MDKTIHNQAYLLATHGSLWAMDRARLEGYAATMVVDTLAPEQIEQRTGPRGFAYYDEQGTLEDRSAGPVRSTRRAIAVLPLLGPISQRAGLMTALFGGSSTERFGRMLDETAADASVGAIVLEVDSPGGSVAGVPELAVKVAAAKAKKPVVAVANGMMASAAYWIGSQASELVVTPSGEVGSIGVWSMHTDLSEALAKEGVKVTLISAGPHKTELNPYEPPSLEALEYEQQQVDRYYGEFVDAVADGRRKTAATVRKEMGGGRLVGPKAALAAGMADRVATIETTIRRLGGRLAEQDRAAAEAERRRVILERMEREDRINE